MKETRPDRLFAGSRLIGWLYPEAVDYPRVYARFEEAEAFEEVRDLFRRQNASPHSDEIRREMDALDLRIVDPIGHEDRLVRIMIDGTHATWRGGFLRGAREGRTAASGPES